MPRTTQTPSRRSVADRNALVIANLKLVGLVIQRTPLKRLCEDDARQAGYLGLIRAASLWDESRGIKFSTYAYYSISNAMKDAARKAAIIRLPHNDLPNPATKAAARRASSVARLPGGDGWHPSVGPDTGALEDREERQAVAAAVAALPLEERELLHDRFTRDLAIKHIAANRHRAIGTIAARLNGTLARLRVQLSGRTAQQSLREAATGRTPAE